MSELTLSDITQAQYDAAEQTVIALLRNYAPNQDLRAGTVLREQLIRPAAMFHARDAAQREQLRQDMSLANLATQANPDPASVNSALSNFNLQMNAGVKAAGQLAVSVDGARAYTVVSGFTFATADGRQYIVPATVTFRLDPDLAAGEQPLRVTTAGTYYFILDVQAAATGSAYDLPQGTALDPVTSLYGYVMTTAYTAIAGGRDSETVAQLVTRLPAAITHRSLTNRNAIEATLRSQFDAVAPIQAVSVLGFGDTAQLRDKHNPLGWAVGSRLDVYVRTFTAPSVALVQKTGTLVAANTYSFEFAAADAPGFYVIRSVTNAQDIGVTSSYAFTVTRAGSTTAHDITADSVEVVGTAYQTATVTVTGVPSSDVTWGFKVEVYTEPRLAAMQAYVDARAVRNLEADIVMRCPLICLTECSAVVYRNRNTTVDVPALRQRLVDYVNGRSFVDQLTRSELVAIMLDAGATRVDLTTGGMRLQGRVCDAVGVWHTLSGDTLDLRRIADPTVLLDPATCVFAMELRDVNLTVVVE